MLNANTYIICYAITNYVIIHLTIQIVFVQTQTNEHIHFELCHFLFICKPHKLIYTFIDNNYNKTEFEIVQYNITISYNMLSSLTK